MKNTYESLALGASALQSKTDYSDQASPCTVLAGNFIFQSYLDTTLLENALLTQIPNDQIVASTRKEVQISGYSVGLHPSSQTPVAVRFKIGGRGTSSDVFFLKPGQVITPAGDAKGNFTGLEYGCPFGWLGGGNFTLLVFRTPDAEVNWHGNTEIIFHRVTIPVLQPSDLTAAGSNNNARRNWPISFPWNQALRGVAAITQKGQPALGVEPTRTLLALRGVTALAAPADMRLLFQASNEETTSTGAVANSSVLFEDITWPVWAGVGTSGNLASSQVPYLVYTGGLARIGADNGGLALVDLDGLLSGASVDFVRYGRL